MAVKNWIAEAIDNPGALHRTFGVPEGKTIPVARMNAKAAKIRKEKNPTSAQTRTLLRINLANTLRGLHR